MLLQSPHLTSPHLPTLRIRNVIPAWGWRRPARCAQTDHMGTDRSTAIRSPPVRRLAAARLGVGASGPPPACHPAGDPARRAPPPTHLTPGAEPLNPVRAAIRNDRGSGVFEDPVRGRHQPLLEDGFLMIDLERHPPAWSCIDTEGIQTVSRHHLVSWRGLVGPLRARFRRRPVRITVSRAAPNCARRTPAARPGSRSPIGPYAPDSSVVRSSRECAQSGRFGRVRTACSTIETPAATSFALLARLVFLFPVFALLLEQQFYSSQSIRELCRALLQP